MRLGVEDRERRSEHGVEGEREEFEERRESQSFSEPV